MIAITVIVTALAATDFRYGSTGWAILDATFLALILWARWYDVKHGKK